MGVPTTSEHSISTWVPLAPFYSYSHFPNLLATTHLLFPSPKIFLRHALLLLCISLSHNICKIMGFGHIRLIGFFPRTLEHTFITIKIKNGCLCSTKGGPAPPFGGCCPGCCSPSHFPDGLVGKLRQGTGQALPETSESELAWTIHGAPISSCSTPREEQGEKGQGAGRLRAGGQWGPWS